MSDRSKAPIDSGLKALDTRRRSPDPTSPPHTNSASQSVAGPDNLNTVVRILNPNVVKLSSIKSKSAPSKHLDTSAWTKGKPLLKSNLGRMNGTGSPYNSQLKSSDNLVLGSVIITNSFKRRSKPDLTKKSSKPILESLTNDTLSSPLTDSPDLSSDLNASKDVQDSSSMPTVIKIGTGLPAPGCNPPSAQVKDLSVNLQINSSPAKDLISPTNKDPLTTVNPSIEAPHIEAPAPFQAQAQIDTIGDLNSNPSTNKRNLRKTKQRDGGLESKQDEKITTNKDPAKQSNIRAKGSMKDSDTAPKRAVKRTRNITGSTSSPRGILPEHVAKRTRRMLPTANGVILQLGDSRERSSRSQEITHATPLRVASPQA